MKIFLAAIAACFAAAPAAADITARYVTGIGHGPAMTIQVNDHGDSRISMGSQSAILTIGGESYLIEADLSGTYVVRIEDAMAAMRDQLGEMMGEAGFPSPPPPSPEDALEAIERGTEMVAGRSGAVWIIRRHGRSPPAKHPVIDFVISSDSDLAPIGRAFARQFGGSFDAMTAVFGPNQGAPGTYPGAIRTVLEHGTVIRMGRLLRLDRIETGPVPASAFILPAAPLTRAQYAARKGWAAPPPD